MAVRRVTRWLLVRLAYAVALPLLLAFLVFACVMALIVEGPSELLWRVDWAAVGQRIRRCAHVALVGWPA